MWDRVRRWLGADKANQPEKTIHHPPIEVDGLKLTADAPPHRTGPLVGTLGEVRMRTFPGCNVMPDEALSRLIVLIPKTGPALPLKIAPPDAADLARQIRSFHTSREVLFESGLRESPGIWFGDTHLASAGISLGETVEMDGFAYPMFVTGGIAPFPVWGWYVKDGSLTVAGAPTRNSAPRPFPHAANRHR